ncbi:hypothetical protein [Halalkalicoccus ordinarius]|uniref:hypothetical protein n=1 Tax=Halalkalicoccus ordinarius TaxID=3116651 RepID=UPI00300E7E64
MSDKNQPDEARRTFIKGAAATGVAATGLTAFSGSAVGQQQRIRSLNINLTEQDGLLNVVVQNVNALNNVNVEDIVVTVIGGDVLSNIEVDIRNIDVNVEIIDDVNVENVLNNNVVQVAVVALSDTGDIVAQGSDALNL